MAKVSAIHAFAVAYLKNKNKEVNNMEDMVRKAALELDSQLGTYCRYREAKGTPLRNEQRVLCSGNIEHQGRQAQTHSSTLWL